MIDRERGLLKEFQENHYAIGVVAAEKCVFIGGEESQVAGSALLLLTASTRPF